MGRKKEKRREREKTKDEHTLTKIQTQLLAKKQKDGKTYKNDYFLNEYKCN